jgi:hypothetical protein
MSTHYYLIDVLFFGTLLQRDALGDVLSAYLVETFLTGVS